MSEKKGSTEQGTVEQGKENKVCGLVMPISSIDGCSEQHWLDVKGIITDAVMAAGFTARIVSEAEEGGVIHGRIIQNLYDDPIIVCDVSGKNPNVMFELGIRLAFDKPTIIIKDDKTPYSFDTSSIEHLEYPRDLRYNQIIEFKKRLKEKVTATLKKSESDPSYRTFLQHFGKFKVAELETKEVSKEDFIIEELKEIRKSIQNKEQKNFTSSYRLRKTETPIQLSNNDKYDLTKSYIRDAIGIELPFSEKEELNELHNKQLIFNILCNKEKIKSSFDSLNEFWEYFEEIWPIVIREIA